MNTHSASKSSDAVNMEALEALLADPVDIIEPATITDEADDEVGAASIEAIDADVLDAALEGADRTSAVHALYEESEREAAPIATGDAPTTAEDAVPVVKAKKEKKVKEPKVKAAPAPHFHSHSKSDVLLHKLGGKRDVLNLEVADFGLDADAAKAKQDEVLTVLDGSAAKKVGEKAIMLLSGKAATQEVLKRTFTVLARDGFLTSGDKGNLCVDLLAKPYSIGTARSQSNQMFSLLPMLKIATKTEKGRYMPNTDSTVLAATLSALGLTMAVAPAAVVAATEPVTTTEPEAATV